MHIIYIIYIFAYFKFVKCISVTTQPTENFYQNVILFKLNATEEREPAAL